MHTTTCLAIPTARPKIPEKMAGDLETKTYTVVFWGVLFFNNTFMHLFHLTILKIGTHGCK